MNQDRRPLLHSVIMALITVSLAASGISCASAQDGEDIARELLRALLESQLEKHRRKRDPFRPPETLPGQPTPQVRQLRSISAAFAQEASALSASVNTDARRNFYVRRYLPTVLQLEASAAAVRQQAVAATHERELLASCRDLNSEWLTLSHQLRHQRGLSPQTTAVIDRLSRLDEQYCALLQIQQQFDSRRLVREANLLSAGLRHLSDELKYGVPATATRQRLLRRLQHLQHQADYFAGLVADSQPAEAVIQQYQQLYQVWTVVQSDLDRYSHRGVTRGVQRVVATHQAIHDLLRLDLGLDRQLVLHLIRDVEATMNELFQRVTLADLMDLPGSDDVAGAADTAYGTLQHLNDVVQRNETREEVGEALVYMSEAWGLVAWYLQPVRRPEVQHHLGEVAGELMALRETIGAAVVWNSVEMVQRASALEGLASEMLQSIRRWHRAAGISDRLGIQQAQELVSHCHELEQLMIARRPPAGLREECRHITQSWQQLRPYLQQCQTSEREALERLSAEFTPELLRIITALPE